MYFIHTVKNTIKHYNYNPNVLLKFGCNSERLF